ncbi:hypothetical protein EVA_01844, partial [gut metagenome]
FPRMVSPPYPESNIPIGPGAVGKDGFIVLISMYIC